jgi:hypothetical protein
MAFTSEYMVEIEEAQKMERKLAEVTKQRDALAEALTEIEQYKPISENRFAIKSEFYWLAHKALAAVKGGSHE